MKKYKRDVSIKARGSGMSELTHSKLPDIDMLDIQMFLMGHHKWREQYGIDSLCEFSDPDLPEGTPPRTEPFTSASHLEILDKCIDDHEGTVLRDLNNMSPEKVERLRENFTKIGLEKFLDDGQIETNELLVAASEMGKAAMQAEPKKIRPTKKLWRKPVSYWPSMRLKTRTVPWQKVLPPIPSVLHKWPMKGWGSCRNRHFPHHTLKWKANHLPRPVPNLFLPDRYSGMVTCYGRP